MKLWEAVIGARRAAERERIQRMRREYRRDTRLGALSPMEAVDRLIFIDEQESRLLDALFDDMEASFAELHGELLGPYSGADASAELTAGNGGPVDSRADERPTPAVPTPTVRVPWWRRMAAWAARRWSPGKPVTF